MSEITDYDIWLESNRFDDSWALGDRRRLLGTPPEATQRSIGGRKGRWTICNYDSCAHTSHTCLEICDCGL